MNKNIIWWIIGLLCPPVGLILYFIFRKKDKSKSSSLVKGSLVGFAFIGIFILYTATHSIDYTKRNIDEWYNDVKSNNTVVTVIGASYCSHCQEYKPYITSLAKKKNINLYFYEIDTMKEADVNKLENSFDLAGYSGSVPFTVIFKDGKALATHEGFESNVMLYDFFKKNGIV